MGLSANFSGRKRFAMVVSAGERFSPPAIPWRQHIKDLGPEHPLVAQGLLLAGVDFDLGAIQCHGPKTHHWVLTTAMDALSSGFNCWGWKPSPPSGSAEREAEGSLHIGAA